ncbi:MAG: transposase [Opitutaceae bacterium]
MVLRDATYFTAPVHEWQRRYETIRGAMVERIPATVLADRFNYTPGYVRLLKFQFRHGRLDFSEPAPDGSAVRRRVDTKTREKIREWRQRRLSAGEITELLSEDGMEISIRTVERVLKEEGFPKLPRRTRLKIGLTVKGAQVPKYAQATSLAQWQGMSFDSTTAGAFLFAPFLEQLGFKDVVSQARLPSTKRIPALSYLLSFLALKLVGTERYAHVGDHGFDPCLGLFAGLNVLPKCTSMSTYAYSLDASHIQRLQRAFVQHASKLRLYQGGFINLDFHTVPHFGEDSVLEQHWAGARNRAMKGALTLFAQDAESKLMLYTAADIQRAEADDQVLQFVSFWKRMRRGVNPTLVFDSRFTTYANLAKLDAQGIKFITLRRRGADLLKQAENLEGWKTIHIPHVNRKFDRPQVYESTISLRGYDDDLRQVIMRGTGREKPTFIITNDFDLALELVVGNYARRWRVENGIAEAVKFFNLNALSSPILVKVHFDISMTMIADTLYSMLAKKLRGFQACDAPKLYRHFVRGKGNIKVDARTVTVTFPRHAHNPILRAVPWGKLPTDLPGFGHGELVLRFE